MMHEPFAMMGALRESDERTARLHAQRSGCPYAQGELPQLPTPPPSGEWNETLDKLWTEVSKHPIEDPKRTEPRPDPRLTQAINLHSAFHPGRDFLPRPGDPEVKKKLIHHEGAVARIEYTPTGNPTYTGLLATGAKGIMRVSNGNGSDKGGFAPGVAIKFPITGHPSADMLFGVHGDHIDAFVKEKRRYLRASDFLDVPLQTWLGPVPLDEDFDDVRTLFWIFHELRQGPGHEAGPYAAHALSPAPLASVHQSPPTGKPVKVSDPKCPIALQLVPTEAAKTAWKDVRGKAGKRSFRRAFIALQSSVALYEVYAWQGGKNRKHIGTIQTESTFIASERGDELFFQHPIEKPDTSLIYDSPL